MKKIVIGIILTLLTGISCFSQEHTIPEQYFIDFTKYQLKTQDRINLLKNKSNLKKLGKEIVQGKISGTLTYKTSVNISGLQGVITLTWDNYCDDEGWIFNGEVITYANINGDGKLSGLVTTDGILKGSVYYENVTIKNTVAGGGTYGVSVLDFPRQEIPYQVYFEGLKEFEKIE